MCKTKEEFLECIDAEVFDGKMKDASIIKKIQYKYFTPNTSFVYLTRKMWLYANRGGVWKVLSKFYYLKIYRRFGCCVFPEAIVGKGFKVPHPVARVIGRCEIGCNFTILQGTTVGEKNIGEYMNDNNCLPRIGNNVLLGANTCVLGGITITDNVIIGANAVVCHDILESGTYVGIPANKL